MLEKQLAKPTRRACTPTTPADSAHRPRPPAHTANTHITHTHLTRIHIHGAMRVDLIGMVDVVILVCIACVSAIWACIGVCACVMCFVCLFAVFVFCFLSPHALLCNVLLQCHSVMSVLCASLSVMPLCRSRSVPSTSVSQSVPSSLMSASHSCTSTLSLSSSKLVGQSCAFGSVSHACLFACVSLCRVLP